MKRFDLVDFLRGYAILTIMIFHYLQFLNLPYPLDEIIWFGGTGIHLFIVLSGFGLYYSFQNKPIRYFTFLKKRLSKIYVPYIFIVLISALISLFIPIYENSLYALGGHVFLYKMFDEAIIGSYGYPLWFISMIIQFYIIFHLIVWLKSRLGNFIFLTFSMIVSACWIAAVILLDKGAERVWNSFFLQYFWEFALGMVVAERVANNRTLFLISLNQITLLTLALVGCAVYAVLAVTGGNWGKLVNDPFALIGYASVAIFLFNLHIKRINQFFLFIGENSLSIFLVHTLVLLTLAAVLKSVNPILIVAIALIIVVPIAVVYQKLINRFFRMIKV